MKSLGYKRHPMASRESVPVNFQSSGAAWPHVSVKAVTFLFDSVLEAVTSRVDWKYGHLNQHLRVVTQLHRKIFIE